MPFDVKEFINDRILFLKCFLNASFMSDIIPVVIYNACMYNLSLRCRCYTAWCRARFPNTLISSDMSSSNIKFVHSHSYKLYDNIIILFCWMSKIHFISSRWMQLAGEVSQLIFMEIRIVQTVVSLHTCSPIVCVNFFIFLYSLW